MDTTEVYMYLFTTLGEELIALTLEEHNEQMLEEDPQVVFIGKFIKVEYKL